MAEYTAAIAAGKPVFYINMIMDVSPDCDCHSENDAPILPDLGMLASFDAVALDQACADLCLRADPLPNSQLTDHLENRNGIIITILSRMYIPIQAGGNAWHMLKRSAWAQGNMS